ncbi:MAG: hypothetical protein HZC42_10195 [Candidatus Eisenbacteria bacterium]|nr:hypothetical protein [Candidatus Eisenbacteria bacterium]
MKTRILFPTLVLLAAAALTGCSKEPTRPVSTPAAQAPSLPPAETMQFDFSFFEPGARLAADRSALEGSTAAQSKSNWINAAVRVAFINLMVADAFAPPTLAFQAAIHTRPVLQPDGWFLWTYVWSDTGAHQVTVRLRGRVDGALVTWQLRVSDNQAAPPVNDFLWFSGQSRITNESGYWVFNELKEGNEVEVARIDWINRALNDRELAFTNIKAGTPDQGDRLTYKVAGAIVSVLFHDQSESRDADITWNRIAGSGSLLVPDYNNGERACWDERQENMVCPPTAL